MSSAVSDSRIRRLTLLKYRDSNRSGLVLFSFGTDGG